MALISMKTDSSECMPCEPNPYGYGLRIRLNEGQCEALGITTPPAAGSKLTLQAAAFVASATQSVEQDGDDAGPDVYLELQITDLSIGTAQASASQASLLYSGDND